MLAQMSLGVAWRPNPVDLTQPSLGIAAQPPVFHGSLGVAIPTPVSLAWSRSVVVEAESPCGSGTVYFGIGEQSNSAMYTPTSRTFSGGLSGPCYR